jgi:hypothetical protein
MNPFTVPPSTTPVLSVVPGVRLSAMPIHEPKIVVAPPPPPPAPEPSPVVPTSRVVHAANRAVVTIYKVVGLGMLTVIVGGLLSYLGVHAFYLVNRGWVLPTALSPSDERVLRVSSMIAQEGVRRDALLAQRLELAGRLEDARRTATSETAFQESFNVALQADLSRRADALSRFQSLLAHYEHAKSDIFEARKAYAGMSKAQIADDFGAHLIDKGAMINSNFQLAEIAGADLALRERTAEVADRVATLAHDVRSFRRATNRNELKSAALSFEILRSEHEYDLSVLASQKAKDDVQRLEQSLAIVDQSLVAYEQITRSLAGSPFALGADQKSTVIFVPYENLANVAPGAPLYACSVPLLGCHQVGKVGAVIDGELLQPHPVLGQDVRGVMVHVLLDDPRASQKPVLHVGRKPLFV